MSQKPSTSKDTRFLDQHFHKDQRFFRPAYRYGDKECDSSEEDSFEQDNKVSCLVESPAVVSPLVKYSPVTSPSVACTPVVSPAVPCLSNACSTAQCSQVECPPVDYSPAACLRIESPPVESLPVKCFPDKNPLVAYIPDAGPPMECSSGVCPPITCTSSMVSSHKTSSNPVAIPSITTTETSNGFIKCFNCEKMCKGVKGMKIHFTKAHPNVKLEYSLKQDVNKKSNKTENDYKAEVHGIKIDILNDQSNNENTIPNCQSKTVRLNSDLKKCDLCGKFFKCIKNHLVSGHPDVYRQNLLDKHITIQNNDQVSSSEKIDIKLQEIKRDMQMFNEKDWSEMNDESLNSNIDEFQVFLKSLIHKLPGPKHPAVKYYELRKKGKTLCSQNSKYKHSSNPERKTKRDRKKRKEAYIYQSVQFQYYNCRKKAVRKILDEDSRPCPIKIEQFENSFENTLGSVNTCTDHLAEVSRENGESFQISIDDVTWAIKKMNMDTSAGVDGVLVRAVKFEGVSQVLVKVFNRLLELGTLAKCWKLGRTIMLDKGDQVESVKNWRPITILPVLRRIFEKILEKKLREHVIIDINQRGFMPLPGCAINLTVVETALDVAKKDKSDLVVLFVDINQAYNNVGHDQIKKSLDRTNTPNMLKNMILDCQIGNFTKIHVGRNCSKNLELKRGLMQGAPLSPILYNLATNHIVEEITEEGIVNTYGVKITDSYKTSAMAFADDLCILGNSLEAAESIFAIVNNRLHELGMCLNPSKTQAIVIKKGVLVSSDIIIGGKQIKTASQENHVKYLGTALKDKIVLEKEKTISELNEKIEKIVKTPYLKADQKILVLNTYIWPILTFKLQNTPVDRWSIPFIEDFDKLVRSATKQILEIPRDVPDAMMYSSKNMRGLQMFKFSWEIIIQRINLFLSLKKQPDDVINMLRDLDKEIQLCLNTLDITDSIENISSRSIREELRKKEFEKWKEMKVRGVGVCLYKDGKQYNKWLSTQEGISNSEMTDLYKMTSNTAAVRSLPGRSQDGVQCRRCPGVENKTNVETLAHVLGACPFGHLQRVARHNTVRSLIANELKKNLEVYEEVNGLAEDGSIRRIDIIAIDRGIKKGFIIDPTIRFEFHQDQPEEVNQEKKNIYEPTISHYKIKYGLKDIEVIGLMIGSRGTLTSVFIHFCKRFNIPQKVMKIILHHTIRSSIAIVRSHLYR